MPEDVVSVPRPALDRLMPLHLVLDGGTIRCAGPTMRRLRPSARFEGADFADMFVLRRPHDCASVAEAIEKGVQSIQVAFADDGPATVFKGQGVRLAGGCLLLDLSFGLNVAEAVADYTLTAADFAPSDLAVEMLYLVEAKSAAMEELRGLNARLELARSAAERRASTDALTGLRNRHGMMATLSGLVARKARFGLVRVDLDHFKLVNDTLGHAAGDEVLTRVGQVLREETRESDTVFRTGGDEFVLVSESEYRPDGLRRFGERVVARVGELRSPTGEPFGVTVSLGATSSVLYRDPDPERMLEDADRALYVSKTTGRGRVSLMTAPPPAERRALTPP